MMNKSEVRAAITGTLEEHGIENGGLAEDLINSICDIGDVVDDDEEEVQED